MGSENRENPSEDKSREILERAFNEPVIEEYNAPHEFKRRKKGKEETKDKPGFQRSNEELKNIFTSKELKNLKAIKISLEAGEVGGDEDDISIEERVKLLKERMGRRFNRLEAIKWQVEHGQLGESEARGELEPLPSRGELEKKHTIGNEEVLDDKTYVRPGISRDEDKFDKTYWDASVNRKGIIEEIRGWKEKYDVLAPEDKKFFIEGLHKMAYDREITEEIMRGIEEDPSDRSLYELYGNFNVGKGLFTSRFSSILLKPEVVEDPKRSEIRGRLCELIANDGQPESVRVFYELAERVQECSFEDVDGVAPDEAILLREDEQKRILRAVQILELNIAENPVLSEEEIQDAEQRIQKLKDEINNNIEAFQMDYEDWQENNRGQRHSV